MRIRRLAISAAFATGLAALPLATARAQYYCPPTPLAWPFCAAGAIVGTAAAIATAPFWLLAGAPYYGYAPPLYPVPSYYPAGWGDSGAPSMSYADYGAASGSYAPPPSAPEASPEVPAPMPPPPPPAHPSGSSAPAPLQHAYYYFCPESHGYYPYVAHCAVAWRRVPTTPPQESAAGSTTPPQQSAAR